MTILRAEKLNSNPKSFILHFIKTINSIIGITEKQSVEGKLKESNIKSKSLVLLILITALPFKSQPIAIDKTNSNIKHARTKPIYKNMYVPMSYSFSCGLINIFFLKNNVRYRIKNTTPNKDNYYTSQ